MRLQRFQPTIKHLEEPLVEVGDGVTIPEPKMGWTLLGPAGKRSEGHNISIGLIGDKESIEKTKDLIQRLNITTYGKDKTFLHVDFPGLEKLRISFNVRWTEEISKSEVDSLDKAGSFTETIEAATKIMREKIRALMEREPTPDVIVLAYPEKVDYLCIERAIGQRRVLIKTSVEKAIEKARSKNKTLDQFMGIPVRNTFRPRDLRSMVKSICMEYDIPVQIIRPSTTKPYDADKPAREDDATVYWNLVVALFYKANNIPWHVKGLMQDTCYLGISFFRDRDDFSSVKTALAQVFSLDAEGFVLKGKKAYVDDNNAPHISRNEALRLIHNAIEVYKRNKDGQPPKRIVIHKTSRFNEDEIEGFKAGAVDVLKVDLVAFGTRDIKLMRWGKEPPIRGTMVRLPDSSVLLYTFGYIPYLDVYPGPRVPSPLEILEHHGESSMERVCREIMSLTKLNWNNAKFCSKAPITIAFAKRVGGILRESPPETAEKEIGNKLKFYM
jgi:hypothetical protein